MSRRAPGGLAVLAALAAAGCRLEPLPPPPPPAADPSIAAVRTAAALPFRLAVAPLRPPPAPPYGPRLDAARHEALPDLEAARASLVDALAASGLFARVVARGAPGESVDEAAWRAGDDLVLELDIEAYRQEYLGHANYVGWFSLLSLWVWPAWFVPVDWYGVGIEARGRLRGVQGAAEALLTGSYVVAPADAAQALTPTDRELVGPLDLLALWSVETSLDEGNWRAIDRAVAPHAWRRLEGAVVRDLAARVASPLTSGPPAAREALLRRARKRFAVVVGVSRHVDPTLAAAPLAAADAAAVASAWAGPQGGLVPGRDLTLLVDGQATRAAVLQAVAHVGSRAAPGDEVLLYLGGSGVVGPDGRPGLLPHDAHPGDAGLALEELAARLPPGVRAGLLVDAGFGAAGASRSGGGPLPDLDRLAGALAGRGAGAILAGGPGQGAHDLRDAASGLLTHLILEGLRGAADADRDGRVTWAELARHAVEEGASRAGLEGVDQAPRALGQVELGWPR